MRVIKRRNAEHKFIKYNKAAHVVEPKERTGKRRPWTFEEDEIITRLVRENGTRQWALIAEKLSSRHTLHSRTGKQCRERWHNHLSPSVSKNPWTSEEEFVLFDSHFQLGNKWAEITKLLPGRTDNSIKNHFYSSLRRQFRKLKGKDPNRAQLKKYDSELTQAILSALQRKLRQRSKQQQRFLEEENEQKDFDTASTNCELELPELMVFDEGEMQHYCMVPVMDQMWDNLQFIVNDAEFPDISLYL